MYGSKPNRFFFTLEKNTFENKVINLLMDENGNSLTESDQILVFEKRQCEERYSCRVKDGDLPDPYFSVETGVLDNEEKDYLDRRLTLE